MLLEAFSCVQTGGDRHRETMCFLHLSLLHLNGVWHCVALSVHAGKQVYRFSGSGSQGVSAKNQAHGAHDAHLLHCKLTLSCIWDFNFSTIHLNLEGHVFSAVSIDVRGPVICQAKNAQGLLLALWIHKRCELNLAPFWNLHGTNKWFFKFFHEQSERALKKKLSKSPRFKRSGLDLKVTFWWKPWNEQSCLKQRYRTLGIHACDVLSVSSHFFALVLFWNCQNYGIKTLNFAEISSP